MKNTQRIKIYNSKCLKKFSIQIYMSTFLQLLFRGTSNYTQCFKLHLEIFNDLFFLEYVGSSSLTRG